MAPARHARRSCRVASIGEQMFWHRVGMNSWIAFVSNPVDPLANNSIALQAMFAAERAEDERSREIIKELQRDRFSRRPESLPRRLSSCWA